MWNTKSAGQRKGTSRSLPRTLQVCGGPRVDRMPGRGGLRCLWDRWGSRRRARALEGGRAGCRLTSQGLEPLPLPSCRPGLHAHITHTHPITGSPLPAPAPRTSITCGTWS